ncbi:MAG: hypothetical protein GXO77_16970 [Calditrichaeota bacterium]|nr:hypothetical protein [Calditrichota bacterium]
MKHLLVLTLILTLGLSTLSYAQFEQLSRQPQIEVFGGIAIPLSPEDFSDYYKLGYSINGQYVIFPSPRLGVSFTVAFEPFTFDGDKFMEDIQAEDPLTDYSGFGVDGTARILELGIGVRPYLTSPEATTQFFLFGMGTYNVLKTEASLTYNDKEFFSIEDKENKFGIAGGAGFEMPMTESLNLIIQGVFRLIFTEDESTSFLGVTAGAVF